MERRIPITKSVEAAETKANKTNSAIEEAHELSRLKEKEATEAFKKNKITLLVRDAGSSDKKRVMFYLTKNTIKKISKHASMTNRSMSEIIELLVEALDK